MKIFSLILHDMRPILEVRGIGKKFRIQHKSAGYLSLRERMLNALKFDRSTAEDFWALKDVSFDVQPGESIGIIGRNGAGKSTLLKILSKITPPTTGLIESRGRIASLLEVGTGFHPELTGRENIFFNGSLLGMKRREIEVKFDEIVDFSGVDKFLDTPLKHFSSGMQLRLAFAVAAFLDPEILVIDEVLAVGDAEFQKKCLGKMENVTKSGRTILFVSHNMAAVKHLCSSCIRFDAGVVTHIGETGTVISRYLSAEIVTRKEAKPIKPVNAEIWIERIAIVGNSQGLHYGDPLKVQVAFRANAPVIPYVGFVITSMQGTPLLNSNNRYQSGNPALLAASTGTLMCDFGVIPLMRGTYFLSVYLGNELGDEHVIENAISFEVFEKDVWGKGKLPPQNASEMWWPTRFNFVQ